jgi:hypothetical protein
MMARDDRPFAATALRLSGGAIVWAAHFAVIYGFTGLACARGFSDEGAGWITAVPWVIGISTVLGSALAVLFIVPVLRARRSADFTDWMSAGVAAFAINAMVLEGIAVLWVPVCA